jgi:hypothetical protein
VVSRLRSAFKMLIGEKMYPEQFAQLCAQQKSDCEKRSQELLQTLPRCTASVVVAGPSYSDKYYVGDVVADSAALLPWAVHHAANSSYRPIAEVTAAPPWLTLIEAEHLDQKCRLQCIGR